MDASGGRLKRMSLRQRDEDKELVHGVLALISHARNPIELVSLCYLRYCIPYAPSHLRTYCSQSQWITQLELCTDFPLPVTLINPNINCFYACHTNSVGLAASAYHNKIGRQVFPFELLLANRHLVVLQAAVAAAHHHAPIIHHLYQLLPNSQSGGSYET